MTDFQGTEIKVGDKVAYIHKGPCGLVHMCIGVVKEIKGRWAYVDNNHGRGVTSVSIYKLEDKQ